MKPASIITDPFRHLAKLGALALLALLALCFGPTAFGQTKTAEPIALPLSVVAAATTNTSIASSNVVIKAYSTANVGVQPSFALMGAGTTAVVFLFDASINGIDWESGAFSVSVTPAGSTRVTKNANFALNSFPQIRLAEIRNPNASILTNLTMWWSAKPGN